MPTIDETMVTLVLGDSALTAVINNKFLPDTIGTSARPAVAYQRISNPRDTLLKTGEAGLGRARVQLTIFARTAQERSTLKQLFRARLVGYRDRYDGGVIDRIVYDDERDQHDGTTNDFMSFVDYIIWHIEE